MPAQTERRSGIEGYISSDVADAIELKEPQSVFDSITKGLHRQAASNGCGYYLVDYFNPGAYSVWAEVKGLGCIIYRNISVFPGKRVRQDFHFVRAKRNPDNCQPVETTQCRAWQ